MSQANVTNKQMLGFLRRIYDESPQRDDLIKGMLDMKMDGTFSYTTPIQGTSTSLPSGSDIRIKGKDWNWYHPGTNIAGWFHTHGRPSPDYQFFTGSLMRSGITGDTDITIQGISVPAYLDILGPSLGHQGKIVKYTSNRRRPQPKDFQVLQRASTTPVRTFSGSY